ncbi:MAG: DNA helicase RecQ [Spirochaetaceae bacterium]|jgi:ATP-dependent DNA helicase RecQ|nr:DNA helicase RecQ [Spirochaetaceae bacterium]
MNMYAVLGRYFGYERFRPGQKEVIGAILAGQDTLAVMPTGAGKSICYQIPAMMLEGLAVVISPLISLMKDQVNALTEAGIPAACLNSSLAPDEYAEVLFNAKNGMYKLLYIAPERLQRDDVRCLAGSLPVKLVVVDEAHCVSHWGHDFRPSYLLIPDFIGSFPTRPVTAAFTATATSTVRGDIVRHLNLRSPFTLVTGFNRENLYFEVQKPANKMNALLELLSSRKNESGIIYCSTRKAVEDVCNGLSGKGFNVTRYHAGLNDRERRVNQDDFIYDRRPLIVATNAFGMGIDKSNVSFVIHYNMPKNIESYYQEAGRAGRDGGKASCILLYSPRDVHINEFLIKQSRETSEGGAEDRETDQKQIAHNLEMLKQMTFYATTNECLRGRLLSYFGENAPAFCGSCSNCATEFESIDISVAAQKIVSCVYRMKQQGRDFGKMMIINVLRGSKNEKIKSLRLDSLSTYGIMSDMSQQRIRVIIDYLIDEGYLVAAGDEYPVVQLCARSREIIGDKKTLTMMLPKEKPKRDVRLETAAAESAAALDIDETLLDKLKSLRRRFAEEAGGVPAYIIFTDATLRDMCRKLPQTTDGFLNVSGVGEVKSKKFGEAFVNLITGHITAGE